MLYPRTAVVTESPFVLAAAVQAGATESALACLQVTSEPAGVATAALALLERLLCIDAGKDAFHSANGASQLQQLLKPQAGTAIFV